MVQSNVAKISVVINVVREEVQFLPTVLASVKAFADEIILVDMTATKEVEEIARKFDAKVYSHEFVDYVEPARNFGIDKSTSEWILILDPDEELTSALSKKLKQIVADNEAEYVRVPRKNVVFGKWLKHSRWWPDYNIRFFKKGYVIWNEVIHSVPMTTGRAIDLDVKEDLAIVHNHYQTIEQYLLRMNRYSTRQAENLVKEGHEFFWFDVIKKPANEFFSRFFYGEGYKDGIHGLVMALLQAFSELVVYLKVWQDFKFKEANIQLVDLTRVSNEVVSDLRYWIADSQVKKNGGIIPRIKRKFKLP